MVDYIIKYLIVVYLVLLTFGAIYQFIRHKKELQEETNYWFRDRALFFFILLSNWKLTGFRESIEDLQRYIILQNMIKMTYKFLESLHKKGILSDEDWQKFLDSKKGKTKSNK